MSDDLESAEKALEAARDLLDPVMRNIRIFDAEQRLYRAQKRQLDASIKRRAKLQKAKP